MSIPKTNIKWNEVRDTLNEYGGSVTNSVATAFSASANIHWPARWKPVSFNINFCQDHNPEGSDYKEGWWKASVPNDDARTGRCGVYFPEYTSTASMAGVTETLWKHDPPTGGETAPFRLGDFAGYNPEARDIIVNASVNPSGDISMSASGLLSNIMVNFYENHDTDALDYSEIRFGIEKFLSDFYFGVIAIKDGGAYHGVASSPYTLEGLNSATDDIYYAQHDHHAYIYLNYGLFGSIGEYDLYPVLFADEQTARSYNGAISCGTYIPLPVAPIRVNVVNAVNNVKAQPIAVSHISSTIYRVTVRLTNESSTSYTFGSSDVGNYIEAGVARYYEYVEGGGEYNYVRYTSSSFTLSANSTRDITIDVSNSEILSSDTYLLAGIRMRFQETVRTNEGFPFEI